MATAATNRFDLIRLVLAGAVAVYHAVVLTNVAPQSALESTLALGAELGVQGFFIVSGALVAGSFERSQTFADYAGKRVRRLYPAYALVILIPALISLLMTRQFSAVAQYLAANLVFLNFLSPELPGLFAHNRLTEVNGALWTLKIEVMFYIALPIVMAVLAGARRAWPVMIFLIYVASEVWRIALPHVISAPLGSQLAHQLPGQMSFFIMGIALWKLWPVLQRQALYAGLGGAVVLALSLAMDLFEPLRALGLAGVIAAIAFLPGPALNAARFGDISYGLYILHFPVLQACVMLGLFQTLGWTAGFALAGFVLIALSFALWHLVEKPALRASSHYRKVGKPG
jgi:peptidoglycan/LPS O-acetylase OafA/YrhL